METTVKLKYIKQSPKKVRFVLNSIRNFNVDRALRSLDYSNKKAGRFISKALRSGLANLSDSGESNYDPTKLYIVESFVDAGPPMKRFRPAAMGRATSILKRSSHLTLTISSNKKKKG